jgi:hypothetical protein
LETLIGNTFGKRMVIIFNELLLLKLLESYTFAFHFKAKIKFGHGYGDAREFPYLGTSKVITLVNKNKKGIDKSVCVSLSNESLITIGKLVSWRLSSLHYHEH